MLPPLSLSLCHVISSGTLSAEPAPFWMELVLPKQQSEYVLVTNAEDLGPLSGRL